MSNHLHDIGPAVGLDDQVRPKARDDLDFVAIANELVMSDTRSGELHHLDQRGALVWSLLDGTATLQELAADLAEAFGEPAAVVERDLRSLVAGFAARGLLSIPPAHADDSGQRPGRGFLADPPAP